MEAIAILGYGMQICGDDGIWYLKQEFVESIMAGYLLEDNYPNLTLEFGGYDGIDRYILFKPSINKAIDWTPEVFDALPKINYGEAMGEFMRFCSETKCVLNPKWWLIPLYW